MSRGSGSSLIPVAVFLAILLIVLPVSADNVTANQTTVAPSQTTVPVNQTTVTPTQTSVTPTQTTVAVTRTTTVVTTATPTPSAAETIATGSIAVYSSPSGASFLIDGVYGGITPQTVNAVYAGNHILRLQLSGYYDYEGTVYVVPGQMTQGYGTLQPLNQVTSAAPTPVPTATTQVIVPVATPTAMPTYDPGLFGNPTIIAAIIGSVTVLVVAGISLFIHLTPPRKQ
jgi:hypothetical protein